jgi:hypothetical protein
LIFPHLREIHLPKGQVRKIEKCSGFCVWLFQAVERAAEDLCDEPESTGATRRSPAKRARAT